jgi:small subunit ribosomal protein S20
MPQTKQAEKEIRKSKRRTENNNLVRKNLEYLLRIFKKAIEAGDKSKTEETYQKIVKSIDKAAKKNIVHENKAARTKSRLAKKIKNIDELKKPVEVSKKKVIKK